MNNIFKYNLNRIVCAIFVLIVGTPVFSFDIDSTVEEMADKYFQRASLVELLYDKDVNIRKAFSCDAVLLEHENDKGAIDSSCLLSGKIFYISTSMGKKRRLSGAYVCIDWLPGERRQYFEERSFEKKLSGSSVIFRMGRTDGWLREFENVFVVRPDGFSCWSILRR